jgi:hypothetical protein
MKIRWKMFRRDETTRLGAIRGYQRVTSGAEAAPVVPHEVYSLNDAVKAKRAEAHRIQE